MDDSSDKSINFSSIKNLSEKALKEIGCSRIMKICLEKLGIAENDIEIFKFILNDYLDAVQLTAEHLENEVLSIVLPEVVEYFKNQLLKDQHPEMSVLMILCNLLQHMKTKVFVDNPNPLIFVDSFSKFLEIAEMSFKYSSGKVSEKSSSVVTKFSFLTLSSLQSSHYFFSEVADNDSKFRDIIFSLLSLFEISSGNNLILLKITLGKILQNNLEAIVQRINSPAISKALEAAVKTLNEQILGNVYQFLNGDLPDLEPTKVDLKLLISLSEKYAENFRGHQYYLDTLLKLLQTQNDEQFQKELREDIHQHVIVAYMVALKWLFKCSRFHQVLAENLELPGNEVATLYLSLEVVKLVLKEDKVSVLRIYCPDNEQNIFALILKFLFKNEWILLGTDYEELLVCLTSLLNDCAVYELEDSLEFMEDLLIQHFMMGQMVLGTICTDVLVLFARLVSPRKLLRYFQFFHAIYTESSSLISSDFQCNRIRFLLQNFYRLMLPKMRKTVDIHENLKGILDVTSGEEEDRIVEKFAAQVDALVAQEADDVGTFYEMLSNLLKIYFSSIKSTKIFKESFRKLLNVLKNVENVKVFNSFILILLQVVENTSDFPTILQLMMPVTDFLTNHQHDLSIEVKYKVIQLLEQLVKKTPRNFGSQGFENTIFLEIKKLAQETSPLLKIRLFDMFSENPETFLLKQMKKDQMLKKFCKKESVSRKNLEIAKFLANFDNNMNEHFCMERTGVEETQVLFEDVDWRPEPDSTTSKFDFLDSPPTKRIKSSNSNEVLGI